MSSSGSRNSSMMKSPSASPSSARGRVIEFRSNRLPDGGVLTTYTDVTAEEESARALAEANDRLEIRVAERTEELTRVNGELNRAKASAMRRIAPRHD